MVRRTRAQSKTDDIAFPIRVKIAVPPRGLGPLLDAMQEWLQREAGPGQFARHPAPAIGGDAVAYHFRSIELARRFLEAFPAAQLADGTRSPAYYSPARP